MENDNVESVDCYHLEDLDQFQLDMEMSNNINMTVGGSHSGDINNVWTYYGNIEYKYHESINLLDKTGNVVEPVSNIDTGPDATFVVSQDDWVVTLVEKVNWGDGDKVERKLGLYIYCPHSYETYDDDEIYNQIKNGGY